MLGSQNFDEIAARISKAIESSPAKDIGVLCPGGGFVEDPGEARGAGEARRRIPAAVSAGEVTRTG
jgi:hypothetical protein